MGLEQFRYVALARRVCDASYFRIEPKTRCFRATKIRAVRKESLRGFCGASLDNNFSIPFIPTIFTFSLSLARRASALHSRCRSS